jgi:triacylglycerol lipase
LQLRGWFSPAHAEDYREGTDGAGPVVLLPGVWETWQIVKPLADLARAHGRPVHVVTALKNNVFTVADSARIVAEYLDEHDLRNVTILAHSKGGLIGKYLMLRHDPAGRIHRMAAVASPFSGSRYARFVPLPSIRAFSPRDATTVMLLANLEVNARITSLYGVFDPHIPGGSELSGATNTKLDVAGHFRILGSRPLAAELDAFLEETAEP